MRRFLFGVVIASVTATVPNLALGGDREIAKTVMAELQEHKEAGQLKGFDINLKVVDGVVYLTGDVATREQRSLIAKSAASAAGSQNVVNEIKVRDAEPAVRPASNVDPNAGRNNQDTVITDAIYDSLASANAEGKLRGFDLDISTVNGDVWIRGNVSSEQQKSLVIDVARRTQGVTRVIDDVIVAGKGSVRPVSTDIPAPMAMPSEPIPVPQESPVPQGSSMPVLGYVPTGVATGVPAGVPQPMGSANMASYAAHGHVGGHVAGGPVPMHYAGAEYGMGAPRYDQPNLPNYAWPTYAAHPNYAAVTYPKQYSPSAWPYIGPFYPYPQVPLGWRKVSLQWDDGLWHLDFTGK